MSRVVQRRYILEGRGGAPDGMGGRTTAWVQKGTHWGRLVAGPGRLVAGEGGPRAKGAYRIVIRAVPFGTPSRPEAGDRLRENDRIFHVRAVIDTDEAGQFLACYVDEEVRP